MAHSHSADGAAAPNELTRHRRALRILIVMLIPLGIWTVAGLIMLWPGDISEHVNTDVAGISAAATLGSGVRVCGRRVGIVTNAGGPWQMAADRMEDRGLAAVRCI